jgi:hypothetical protein
MALYPRRQNCRFNLFHTLKQFSKAQGIKAKKKKKCKAINVAGRGGP